MLIEVLLSLVWNLITLENNAVAPENMLSQEYANTPGMVALDSMPVSGNEVADLNMQSLMIDKSNMDKSQNNNSQYIGHNINDDNESDDEDIIPEDERWKTRKWFWQMNEQIRIKWDLFVMILATWNWFAIPFNAAFSPDFMESIAIEIFNALIDLLFMVDVFINFRTSFLNSKTGEEIFDLKAIAKNYLRGRFWLDILASLPLDLVTLFFISSDGNTTIFELFGLLKLVRVLRLSRIIMYMNLKDDIKMSLKLVKLVFFLVMYIHCQGWAWHLIVKGNKKWIPPLDYVYITTEIYGDTISMQYWNAIYHSTLLLAGNDIGPRRDLQLIFCVTTLLIWAIINANIFGNLAVLVSALNRKSTKFQEKLDTVNTAMKNMKLPEETQKKVQNYIMSTQSTLDHQQEMDSFLKLISPSLRLEVTKHIFSMIVVKNEMFKDNEDLVDYLVRYLNTLLYLPEDVIIKQGDKADNLYFLARGETVVKIYDENKEEKYVTTLKIGACFGEIGIIKDWPRTSSVLSKNYTTWAALNESNFRDFRNRYPEIVRKMNDGLILYQDKWKKFLKKTLKNISFLSHDISDVILEDLIYELDTERVETGQYIFKKGFSWDWIYIVIHGEVDIFMENNSRETFIESLSQSSNIGTYSTLQEEDYNFTWKAKTDCTLMMLKFETLEKYRGKYDELNYYLIEYEGFIEDNGAPFWDFLVYRNRKEKLNTREILINGIKRSKNILKSFSRKIEFGDILKRVQETIRRERAEEKKAKKKKFNEGHKQMTQTQINGKMITELKQQMAAMKEMIETLIHNQGTPDKQNSFPEGIDSPFEESHLSSVAVDNKQGLTHNNTMSNPLGNQINKSGQEMNNSISHSHKNMDDDWD